jgi:hypothetical protein
MNTLIRLPADEAEHYRSKSWGVRAMIDNREEAFHEGITTCVSIPRFRPQCEPAPPLPLIPFIGSSSAKREPLP